MTDTKTIAKSVADQFNTERSFDVICYRHSVSHKHLDRDKTRYEFQDGSSIVVEDRGWGMKSWGFGFAGSACGCWTKDGSTSCRCLGKD